MASLEDDQTQPINTSGSPSALRGLAPFNGGVLVSTCLVALAILVWSRLVGLDLSLWHDEIATVVRFVEAGADEILFGRYSTNNHMLFSLITWATMTLAGPTEIVFRYWSVVPALVITGAVCYWLVRRTNVWIAATFLVLLTAHSLVTTLSRQARGYGIAMAAVGFMILAAWRALEPHAHPRTLVAVGVSAAVGIFTLPTVVLPFLALVPLLWIIHRADAIWLLAAVGISSVTWYAGVLPSLWASVDQEFGSPLPWHGLLTGPIQYLALPIARLFEEGDLNPFQSPNELSLANSPLYVLVLALVALGIRRMTNHGSALQAAAFWVPIVSTFFLLAISRVWIVDRFTSFLVIPMLVLVAAGIVETLVQLRLNNRVGLTAASLGGLFLLSLTIPTYERLTTVPVEAFEEVGELVSGARGTVYTNSLRHRGLDYYIDAPLVIMSDETLTEHLCDIDDDRYVVINHRVFHDKPLDTTCIRRAGGERHTFRQLIRGNRIDVWLVGQ